MTIQELPWWRRAQVEAGVSFRLFPWKGLTYAQWAWDPDLNIVWPGRRVAYDRSPEGCWSHPWTRAETYDSATRSSVANYWWLGVAIRLLGLDVGFGLLYRPAATYPEVTDARPLAD